MSDLKRDDLKEMNVIFVHGMIDDLGLSPVEFRIYAHIARRGWKKDCFPSLQSICAQCRCCEETGRDARDNLIRYGMIEVSSHPGRPNTYRLTPPSSWKPELVGTFESTRLARKRMRTARHTPPELREGSNVATPPELRDTHPSGTAGGDPSGTAGGEVYPTKLIQEQVNPNRVKTPSIKDQKTHFKTMELPDGLRSENFRKAWVDWVEFRMSGKKVKRWDMVFQKTLEEMSAWGESDAIAGINKAIMSGWTGVFRPAGKEDRAKQEQDAKFLRLMA